MPKNQEDKLVNLISRLSKAEKRSFTLYVKRNGKDGETKFLRLFQLIAKYGTSEEAFVLKQIPSLKKSQISNLKANLFRQVLTCLRLIGRNKIVEIEIREQVDFARILYDKGMYKACLDVLDKAKKQALEYNYETLVLMILYFEKRIESQHVTGSMHPKAVVLADQSNSILNQIELTNLLSNASLLLYGRYLKHGYVKNEQEYNDLHVFLNETLPEYNEIELQFYQKLYLYQSYVWFYYMTQDFLNNYKYASKWINLFHENPVMKVSQITAYIKGYHNLLNALFMLGKRDRFNDEYNRFLTFDIYKKNNPSANEISLYILFKWTHFLNQIFLNANYQESKDLLELEELMISNTHGWDLNRQLGLYYKIGCVYFGIGDLDKCRHFLNMITNKSYPGFREDIQSFAKILNLIANFDLGNEELVISQLKSLYRFLSKMTDLGAVQMEIISFLRKTPNINKKELVPAFQSLKDKLIRIEKKPFEKRPFLYLDIISWLESKINQTTIKEEIQRKLTQ